MPPTVSLLGPSWERHLLAANKSPSTVRTYFRALRLFGDQMGSPPATSVKRRNIEEYLARRLTGVRPATVALEFRSLQQ